MYNDSIFYITVTAQYVDQTRCQILSSNHSNVAVLLQNNLS